VSSPQNIVRQVIGGEMGPSAREEGVTEAARRLSHALAEIAAVLETRRVEACCSAEEWCVQKAKGAVQEWGVL
jgi:hypothetical protein